MNQTEPKVPHQELLTLARQFAERTGVDLVVSKEGAIRVVRSQARDGCVVVYTDCQTHEVTNVQLKEGDTFYYGDWDGQKCVQKKYTCAGKTEDLNTYLPFQRPTDGSFRTVRYSCPFTAENLEKIRRGDIKGEVVSQTDQPFSQNYYYGNGVQYADNAYYWQSNADSSDPCGIGTTWHSTGVVDIHTVKVCAGGSSGQRISVIIGERKSDEDRKCEKGRSPKSVNSTITFVNAQMTAIRLDLKRGLEAGECTLGTPSDSRVLQPGEQWPVSTDEDLCYKRADQPSWGHVTVDPNLQFDQTINV